MTESGRRESVCERLSRVQEGTEEEESEAVAVRPHFASTTRPCCFPLHVFLFVKTYVSDCNRSTQNQANLLGALPRDRRR